MNKKTIEKVIAKLKYKKGFIDTKSLEKTVEKLQTSPDQKAKKNIVTIMKNLENEVTKL